MKIRVHWKIKIAGSRNVRDANPDPRNQSNGSKGKVSLELRGEKSTGTIPRIPSNIYQLDSLSLDARE